jgi:hypothetical protein
VGEAKRRNAAQRRKPTALQNRIATAVRCGRCGGAILDTPKRTAVVDGVEVVCCEVCCHRPVAA